jgi:hypothetical protein
MRDARQEQDMPEPETTTPDGREQSPPGAEDADAGARNETELPSKPAPVEAVAEAKPDPATENMDEPEAEAAEIPEEEPLSSLDSADETSIREFAQSVMSGLEDAGIEIGASAEPEESAALDFTEGEDGFFAGWDGLLSEERLGAPEERDAEEGEQPLPAEPLDDLSYPFEEPLIGTQSLSEIGAAVALAPEDFGAREDLSIKHDELADAVQSALSSIYGEASAEVASPPPSVSAFTAELQARTARWDAPGDAGVEDALTPQEVILNYFSYDTNGKNKEARASLNGEAGYERRGPATGEDYYESDPYFSSDHQPEWPSSHDRQTSYDGPPSYPAPVLAMPTKAQEPSERENSRLLGAAAIGLIGGIAIAASLAVFVINSYGPAGRTSSNASNRAVDPAVQGYGREVRAAEASETQRSADAAPLAEQAPSVAVSDVVATAGQASPLSIAIKPDASAEQALVSITGVPDGARLNAGVDAGGGNWLLPPHRLKGLSINVSSAASGAFQLGVQLVDNNVRSPLSDKKQFTLRVAGAKAEAASLVPTLRLTAPESAPLSEPSRSPPQLFVSPPSFNTQTIPAFAVAAPPPEPQAQPADTNFRTQTIPAPATQQPAASRLTSLAAPQTEVEDLIREGNKRMREGDIIEARALYQKAVATGDAEAALAMGRSYDPIYFARIDKKNAEPDAAKAFDWYRKAMDAGAAQTAKVRIENLKHFLNE